MNSELLYITRKLGYPASFGTRAGLGDFLEQYPDGVYAENGGGAPIGWESAAVWFGGDSERAAARFERMMSEKNEMSRVLRTRVAGVLVLTFIYRLKSRMVTAIPIVGGQPVIDPTWLYFTMPQGGTVTLTKNGTPTAVTLEYSLDNGNTWTTWTETENVRSLTLAAGQTMHVRNISETSTGFSTGSSSKDIYRFSFSTNTYAGGNINSLLCKNPQNAVITENCFNRLFFSTTLVTAPELPSTEIARGCYNYMFRECRQLVTAPEVLPARTTYLYCYYYMFEGCTLLVKAPKILAESIYKYACGGMFKNDTLINYIYTKMTEISANSIDDWLSGVAATGDFYCPAELTIPTGESGIPSGWTRHDI